MGKIKNKKSKIEEFWYLNNGSCWRIERAEMVDIYLYLPTMKYIYKSALQDVWYGTKNPHPAFTLPEEEIKKIKNFSSEEEALDWLCKKGK